VPVGQNRRRPTGPRGAASAKTPGARGPREPNSDYARTLALGARTRRDWGDAIARCRLSRSRAAKWLRRMPAEVPHAPLPL
jgi:hypothetical protein